MNHIDALRAAIQKDFNAATFRKGDAETFASPCGKFRLNTLEYWADELRWELTHVQIYDQASDEKLFDFFVNESRFFFSWATIHQTDYFICAEDIFGGQTVIDLTNRKMAGYSPGEDGFIWTDFCVSPDGNTLATIGCYWACPYILKFFDFSDPLNLPLREIGEFELLDNDETIVGWLDNQTLKMKGIKREREPEYSSNGGFRMKTVSEQPMEREIKIDRTISEKPYI